MSKLNILIIGAMDRELQGILSFYQCSEPKKLQNLYPVWHPTIERPYDLHILQTFVGDINASISTSLAISALQPDYVFKIGCDGGSSAGLHTGDIALASGFFSTTSWITRSSVDNKPTSDAAVWQSVFGNKPYQVNSENLGGIPYYFRQNTAIGKKYKSFLVNRNQKLAHCYIGAGNMWLFDSGYAKNASFTQIPGRNSDRIWAADMESYAIAQTCHVFNKPFMGFYRVSDNYFENEPYKPEKVVRLFDSDFIMTVDAFLQTMVDNNHVWHT
jgi:adenosylhomocysteine nucleosidase